MCTQLTPFKTIWLNFINAYPIDSFQDHMTWFLHCVPIFNNVYPIDSFQHHMTWFLHCLHNWLLSRPFDLILSMCTQLTPFKTIWPEFYIVYLLLSMCTQLTLFNTIWPNFCHCVHKLTPLNRPYWPGFLYCVPNWFLSRPYHLIFVLYHMIFWLCTQLTPFKTIWPNFIYVESIGYFQDHLNGILH